MHCPGQPEAEWPWYDIHHDTCIDCGACIPECPTEAIFPGEDVPAQFKGSTRLNADIFSKGIGYDGLSM